MVARIWLLVACILAVLPQRLAVPADDQLPRVLSKGELPADRRLGALKDLDGYFPFTPAKSREQWDERAEKLRRQVLVSQRLWPMPERTPANAVIHGHVDRDGYTVEKVYLESYPGHYVTGNLYRPKGKQGKLPGVLCPHGHWANGRFHADDLKTVRQSIVSGGERFEVGGRYPLQARCVQLARMGCVVFHYDMIGYADSVQIPSEVAHGFAKQRPHMDGPQDWGFFSPQAELRLQSIMGLQTYNSIRALDWLSELPDVDPQRIGVTGASGGGTQTFILCGIDARPAVAFPAVMVSTAMQGGCTCENACYLRVGTGNIELAALIAPRPLGMTGADDWTREIASKGLPELKQHFALLGVPDSVMARPLLQFGHNYNYVSRAVMYGWMNKHLKLGFEEPIVEEDFKPLSIAEMSVWDERHPRPASGEDYERSLLRELTKASARQLEELHPRDESSLRKFREVVGGAFDVMIGRRLPAADALRFVETGSKKMEQYVLRSGLLRYEEAGEELPMIELQPLEWTGKVVIWIGPHGKQALFKGDGRFRPAVSKLLDSGLAVVGVDLLYQGEFLADGKPIEVNRRVSNPREFAGYTYGYNHPLFAQRVHDILSAVAYVSEKKPKPEAVYVVGLNGAGPLAAAACAQAGSAVKRAAIDTGGFRFEKLRKLDDASFLPGAVKYGDMASLLALMAPTALWLAGEGDGAELSATTAAYRAARQPVTLFPGNDAESKEAAAIDWLLK